jgi:hypothetical protein
MWGAAVTRFHIRGHRLLLVRGPYEDPEVIRAMDLQQAIQFASNLLETIDRLAVMTNTTITVEPDDNGGVQLELMPRSGAV